MNGQKLGSLCREVGSDVMATSNNVPGLLLRCSLLIVLIMSLVACGDKDDDATTTTNEDPPPAQSPAANNPVPEGVDIVALKIVDGEIDPGDIEFQVDEPVSLSIANEDDQAYRFQIEGLTEAQDIPAGETITVQLTTSSADDYTGQLLADDGSVVDEVSIDVQSASGAS
jgi:hypothetical protein